MNFALFDTEPFLKVVEATYDLSRVDVLARDAEGYLPFFRSNKPFRKDHVFALPFGFYRTAEGIRARWQAAQWDQVRRYSLARGCNVTMTTVGDAAIAQGVHCANNPVLTLSGGGDPSEAYTRNLRLNLKKERNKCQRHGIRLEFSDGADELSAFYRVLATQYVREHRMVFQPFALYARLLQLGAGRLLVAKSAEQGVVGGMFMLSDGPVLHYNWGARLPIANVSVGTLLIDRAIAHAAQAGYRYFDFGSTALSDHDLLDFKLKWGCDNVPVFRYHTLSRPADVDLASSYAGARWCFSRMPVRAAMALMPAVVPWLVR